MNAKMGYPLVFSSMITWALVCGVPAQAVPQFDVTFTADAPGMAPATEPATAGGVSTKPTFVTGDIAGNSVFVQDTYVDSMTGNVFGDGNVVVFTDVSTETSNALLFQGAIADETSTGVHTISLDWIEDKGITAFSSGFIGLTNQPRNFNLSALFLDLGMDAGNIRSGNSVNFGGSLGTAERGVPHHLDWVIDLDQADFTIATEVHVDGTLLHVHQREPIGLPHEGASAFGNLGISTSGPGVGTLAFDNIQIRAGRHVMGALPGDVNSDGVVDIFDVNVVSAHWGETGPLGDANGDMMVDIFDVNLISANWSPAPGRAAATVPEPGGFLLAGMSLLGILCAAWLRSKPAARFQR